MSTQFGRIAALHRAQEFAGRFPAYLKLDVRKYFDSVPHERLICEVRKVIKDVAVIDLFCKIIHAFRGGTHIGLPIGSLTSQHLANLYLNPLDRFIKEGLRIKGYVRYMDDMILWGTSTKKMVEIEHKCRDFACIELGLDLKETSQINQSRFGISFLGCRVYPDHIRLNRRSKIRLRRKLKQLEADFLLGQIMEIELQSRATALIAFSVAGGTKSWQVRRKLVRCQDGEWS